MLDNTRKLAIGFINPNAPDKVMLDGFCEVELPYNGKFMDDMEDIRYYIVTVLVSDVDITSHAQVPMVRQIGHISEYESAEVLARYVDCTNRDGWYVIKEEYCDGYTSAQMYCYDMDATINDGIYIYTQEEVAKKHTVLGGRNSSYVISSMPNMAFQKLQYVNQSSLVDLTDTLPKLDSVYGKLKGFTIYVSTFCTSSGCKTSYYCISNAALQLMRKEGRGVIAST